MKQVVHRLCVLCLLVPGGLAAQEDVGQTADEAAIRKNVEAYVTAFNQADAKALANFWSPEAVYINRLTGESAVGRTAVAEQFAALFKQLGKAKLSVQVDSIQFLSPNVAVEHGQATLLIPEQEPDEVAYTAVYVKRDGQWLLDRVTDGTESEAPSHYQQLKVLEWMIGTWVDEDENATVETECSWTKNRNFLTRSFTVSAQEDVTISGMQIVGWDASAKTIRSWTFDSAGGFAEAIWTQKQDRWYIYNKGVLADGRKASAVNIIKPVDADSFTWQNIERTVGGELLPNIDEVLIVRK